MRHFTLGALHGTKTPFRIPGSSFDTHWHLIGGTGKGKTTAIHTMLHGLLLDPINRPCVVVIDRMGGLSFDLLRWISSEFCTDEVRERLIYVEPAREDVVLGFNPLTFETDSHAFYKVSLAAETVLKGWASQSLGEMPRLARWLFNSFFACALLELTVSDAVHLLMPGSDYHQLLLRALPPRLQYEWNDLRKVSPNEVSRILESTRNRLKPYFESPILRRMFGTTANGLDMHRFMQEGRLLLLNLGPLNRVPDQVADAIGGMVIHEALMTARSLPPGLRSPTYMILDEFQRFVGPDIESAIPEVRQLGIKLLLSHQSFSQLKRGDLDLTNMIFQCQSRMIFGMQGEDADLLAHELASIEFDPRKIKDEVYSRRQRIAGHRIEELSSRGHSETTLENWMQQNADGWNRADNILHGRQGDIKSESSGRSGGQAAGEGGGRGSSSTFGTHETLVPIHEDFLELANRSYVTFDEDLRVWARDIRNAGRGRAFIRLVDQPQLFDVDIKRSAPGHLALDPEQLRQHLPEALDDVEGLKEKNFAKDMFLSPADVDREMHERLERVLGMRPRDGAVLPRLEDQISETEADPFV
jgi:hypothetical protein